MLSRAAVVGLLAVGCLGCSTAEPGEVLVRVEGSVSSLVTTVPEATTTTEPGIQTTTSLPGRDVGSCPEPGGIVEVPLATESGTSDPCAVSTGGQIRFTNASDVVVTVEWGDQQLRVDPQDSAVPTETVGEVLTPGLHAFVTSGVATPTVLVAAPDEGFGVAQVGLRSFGGLRPGQRVTEVEESVGVSIVIASRGAACSLGWVAGDPHSPLLALDATDEDPLILRADATTPGQLTLSQVGIGSELADLQAAYGEQLAENPADDTYVFQPNESIDANYRLVFEVQSNLVTAMRIGRLGEVERSEVCP